MWSIKANYWTQAVTDKTKEVRGDTPCNSTRRGGWVCRIRTRPWCSACLSDAWGCIITGISAIFHLNLKAYGLECCILQVLSGRYFHRIWSLISYLKTLMHTKKLIKNKIKYKPNPTKTTFFHLYERLRNRKLHPMKLIWANHKLPAKNS